MANTECKSEIGIIVGLIDSVMTISTVIRNMCRNKKIDLRDQDSEAIRGAMEDLESDNDVSWLLTSKDAKDWKADRDAIKEAVDILIKSKKIKDIKP